VFNFCFPKYIKSIASFFPFYLKDLLKKKMQDPTNTVVAVKDDSPRPKPGTVLDGQIKPIKLICETPGSTREQKKEEKRLISTVQKKMHVSMNEARAIVKMFGHEHAIEMASAVAARNNALKHKGVDPRSMPIHLPVTSADQIQNLEGLGLRLDRANIPFKCETLFPVCREILRDVERKNSQIINATFSFSPIMPMVVRPGQLVFALFDELLPPFWCSFVYLRHLIQVWCMWNSDAEALTEETRMRLVGEHTDRLKKISDWWDEKTVPLLETVKRFQQEQGLSPTSIPDFALCDLEALMTNFQFSFIQSWERSIVEFYRSGIPTEYLGSLPLMSIQSQHNQSIPEAQRTDVRENTEWVLKMRDQLYGVDSATVIDYVKTERFDQLVVHSTSFENLRKFWFHVFESPNPTQCKPIQDAIQNYSAAAAAAAGGSSAGGGSVAAITDLIIVEEVPPLEPMIDLTKMTEGDLMDE
jgi:hypothetical protein